MKKYLHKLRVALTVWSLLALVVSQGGLQYVPLSSMSFGQKAQAQEQDVEQQTPPQKVVICHATGSPSNPYNRLVVSSKAEGGHFDENGSPLNGHEDDILYLDENAQCPGPVTISAHGTKWSDDNGDGIKDAGESGVPNVTIEITQIVNDKAASDMLSLYAATTTTDVNGHYSFAEIPGGYSYTICEVVPSGWHQTYPINGNNNCHILNPVSLNGDVSYDFGNQIDQPQTVCGNEIKEEGEQCDDGNTVNNDGCSDQCQLETPRCTEQQSGWWGEYFNLPSNHPDVGDFDLPHVPYDDNVHGDPLGGWAPWTADWYDSQYYRFSRADANLNFGDDFFPMDMIHEEQNPAWNNHDFFFAAHWRARVTAPASTTYDYMLRSDDDSWVYIDGVRFDDKDGIHPPATSGVTQMPLSAGDHIIDVFYAERHPLGATMVLTLDERLHPVPAPKNCDSCHSPLDFNDGQGNTGPDYQLTLGDATEFTTRYQAALGSHTGDANFDVGVDVKIDGVINAADYLCAQPYYGNAGPYTCQLDCSNICLNPLDYNSDYEITLSDGVTFNEYYSIQDPKADLNGNQQVDYGDYLCSHDQLAMSTYQCPIKCAPVCGDATLQLRLGEQCDDGNNVDGDGCSATCQNEQVCRGSGTYTLDADFDRGTLINVVHTPSDQLQLSEQVEAFNFIWVAVSSKGTVVKINTDTGAIVGEYKTSPSSQGNGDPSRTTVDKDGSVWLSNRADVFEGAGSVIHIGLVENNQCEDRNANGVIDTSAAQNDIKPWADASGTRNVATAEDECIVHYVKLPRSSGTRHVSVTSNNDVWVAGLYTQNFDLIKGGRWDVAGSGTIIRTEDSVGYGGYGGLITADGVIWSARRLMRWDTASTPIAGNFMGWEHDSYGLCIDPSGNVWNTALGGNEIRKFSSAGALLGTYGHGSYYAQGCVATQNGDIWVAGSLYDSVVGHIKNDGTFVGNVAVGSGPTGVSVDANGKIWSTNYYSGNVSRIDPTAGGLGSDGVTPIGAVDLTTVGLGGNPYNYSDMTGSTLTGRSESGTWTVIHDGEVSLPWGSVTWNSTGSLVVTVATSEDGITFGAPQTITSGQDLSSLTSRYLKVVVSFQRDPNGASPILYDLTVHRICDGPAPICGNEIVETGEQCDDGNTASGDGCSATCQNETPGGPVCGNNVVEEGEQCDEGQLNGQPLHCNLSCSGITQPMCGNEIVETGEQCDDGNENNNDSCSNQCTINQVPPVNPPSGGGGGGGGSLLQANLYIVKQVSAPVVEPGGTLTYTISVTNNGFSIANNVTLDDTLPAGFTFADGGGSSKTWKWDTITPGQTVTVSYVVNVSSSAAVGLYPNTAVVTSPSGPLKAQGFANVEVIKPQVQGVSTVAPAPEKVKVLGFETLPDTSGDWNYLGMVGAALVLVISIVGGRKAYRQ